LTAVIRRSVRKLLFLCHFSRSGTSIGCAQVQGEPLKMARHRKGSLIA
jgi:hypothetical protein